MKKARAISSVLFYAVLTFLAVFFIVPIALVVLNSFKNKLYISTTPFVLPNEESFVGLIPCTEQAVLFPVLPFHHQHGDSVPDGHVHDDKGGQYSSYR